MEELGRALGEDAELGGLDYTASFTHVGGLCWFEFRNLIVSGGTRSVQLYCSSLFLTTRLESIRTAQASRIASFALISFVFLSLLSVVLSYGWLRAGGRRIACMYYILAQDSN